MTHDGRGTPALGALLGTPALGALLGALDPQGPPAGPREIAELLWLAAQLPEGAVVRPHLPVPDASADAPPTSTAATGAGDGSPEEASEGDADEQGDRLFLPDTDTPAEGHALLHPGSPVRVAAAPALPHRRALGRSLRPLKRRVPSRTRLVVDEDATADRIAHEVRWLPVLVPARDRWLDLVLVIDAHGDSAALWQPLGRELLGVLRELGAFRDIRTYWLRRQPDGTPGLSTGPRGTLRSPATVSDPTGRTVTLVLTDGVAPGWGGESLRGTLRLWARSGPAAVLQTLPENLWGQTALAPEPGRFRSSQADGLPTRLHFTPYALGSRTPQPGEIPVPVLALSPEWLAPWARAVAGVGEFDGAAVRLPAAGAAAPDALPPPPAEAPVSFEEFLAQAQPGPFRLAAYLSAAPLNLAVMRLVQSVMLPDSPPSDLAAIVYSGVLRRLPGGDTDPDPLQQAYEFAPGIRERLLSTLRRDEADQVVANVSAYVERNLPAGSARFTAAIADPAGPLLLPAGARHWAEVRSLVNRRRRRRASAVVATTPLPAPETRAPQRPTASAEDAVPGAAGTVVPTVTVSQTQPPTSKRSRNVRHVLITIGVSRIRGGPPTRFAGVAEDVARVRTEFEALGYTTVLPELANDPAASTVLRSIKGWAASQSAAKAESVVVYFAGRTARSGREATLLTSDSEQTGSRISGITISRLHQAFAGHPGALMFVLDTSFPAVLVDPPVAAGSLPPLWVLTCRQVLADHSGSDFARGLTVELSRTRRGFVAPYDLMEFASRIRTRMVDQNPGVSDPAMITLSPSTSWFAFRRFFPDHHLPEPLSPLPAETLPRTEQAEALKALTDWLLRHPEDHRPRIVNGVAGTGKSVLLLMLERSLLEAEAAGRAPIGRLRTVLLNAATIRSAPDISGLWASLATQLALPGDASRAVMSQLAAAPFTVAVLLDHLYEVSTSRRRKILAELVDPLRTLPGVRLVITEDTTRRPLPELGADVEVLRLEHHPPRASTHDDALDRVLASPRAHLIVDGHSVIMEAYGELPPDEGPMRLLERLSQRAEPTGVEITCVFDHVDLLGRPPLAAPRGVRVLIPAPGVRDDEFIWRMVAAEPHDRPIVVASQSAVLNVDVTRRPGARSVDVATLMRWLSRTTPRTGSGT
ncbi:SAV_2336 N-terminal domain-related protein [Streptomyces mangrovisoli]|uniref:NACHT domain-containing protein n=1 Tax=Streptomyces mangrovisoli TaxID=1428628 RepID=A0A1J4NMN7_9ACTN|nr:SAV_2336 N-terminal domain-related protein [Streptomyces mangrovisoli]OIJ63599.1 hypothetical protein WN71_032765 [Streptomyces mangrovisoli]